MTGYKIDLAVLKANFNEAYEVLRNASKQYGETSLALEQAKRKLESAKGTLLVDGTLTGKNQETREAQASQILLAETIKLAEAEDAFQNAKSDFALASLRKEELETYLRIAELEVK